jgi:hypothetical protein
MMKVFALVALIAVCTTAIPNGEYFEDRVPETDLIDISYDPAHEAQVAVTALIQEGKDEGACASLAAATIKEVVDAVDAQQKVLDGLETGHDCHKEGQAGVDAAQKALSDAQSAVTDAEKALSDAQAAPVQFADVSLDTLEEGKCEVFFADAAFTAAKQAVASAQDGLNQAKGAMTAAQNAQTAGQEAQKAAINDCYCKSLAALENAWEAANVNNDANAKAYTKGKHMECVLQGTPPADCQVGEIPVAKKPNMHNGVASCKSAAPTPAPTPYKLTRTGSTGRKTGCHVAKNKQLQYLDRQKVQCEASEALEQFKFDGTGCREPGKFRYEFRCGKLKNGFSRTFEKMTPCGAARGGDLQYLDRQNVKCDTGSVLTGFTFGQFGCGGGDMRYKYQCATPVAKMADHNSGTSTDCQIAQGEKLQYLDRHSPDCAAYPMVGFYFARHNCGTHFKYKVKCLKGA